MNLLTLLSSGALAFGADSADVDTTSQQRIQQVQQDTLDCNPHIVQQIVKNGGTISEKDILVHIENEKTGDSQWEYIKDGQMNHEWKHPLNGAFSDLFDNQGEAQKIMYDKDTKIYLLTPVENARMLPVGDKAKQHAKPVTHAGYNGLEITPPASQKSGPFTRDLSNLVLDYQLLCEVGCEKPVASQKARLFFDKDEPYTITKIQKEQSDVPERTINFVTNYNINTTLGTGSDRSPARNDDTQEVEDKKTWTIPLKVSIGGFYDDLDGKNVNERGIPDLLESERNMNPHGALAEVEWNGKTAVASLRFKRAYAGDHEEIIYDNGEVDFTRTAPINYTDIDFESQFALGKHVGLDAIGKAQWTSYDHPSSAPRDQLIGGLGASYIDRDGKWQGYAGAQAIANKLKIASLKNDTDFGARVAAEIQRKGTLTPKLYVEGFTAGDEVFADARASLDLKLAKGLSAFAEGGFQYMHDANSTNKNSQQGPYVRGGLSLNFNGK